ncbi:MAG: hypothetical protein PUE13_09260 [Clostridiales bacterium]|nr:hypothetical protein [Clostridiales bacterium]
MKRIYEKPSLVMEKFETESILDLSNTLKTNGALPKTFQIGDNVIKMSDNQMLQSIDYSKFKDN